MLEKIIKKNYFYKIMLFIFSVSLILMTTCSLIFYNVPDYVYSNIVGIFIFSLYFGTIESILFVFLIQFAMLKFGLASEVFSYTFFLWLTNVLFIKITQNFIKIKVFKKQKYNLGIIIFISVILMSFFSKPVSMFIFNFINRELININGYMNKNFILNQFRIFGFSGIVTYLFSIFFNKVNKKI